MSGPFLLDEQDKISRDFDRAHRTRVVLAVYTAVVASSRSERDAFDAAVDAYRSENADLPEKTARLAVARIICGQAS